MWVVIYSEGGDDRDRFPKHLHTMSDIQSASAMVQFRFLTDDNMTASAIAIDAPHNIDGGEMDAPGDLVHFLQFFKLS